MRRAATIIVLALLFGAGAGRTQSGAMPPAALDNALAFDSFLVGAPITGPERDRLMSIIMAGYARDPARGARNAASVRSALQTIATHRDDLWRAEMRERMWAEIAHTASTTPDPSARAELELLHGDPRLVATDGTTVVTRSSIAALFAANDLIARAAGQPPTPEKTIAAYATAVRQRFAAMPPREKDVILHAAARYGALRQFWANPTMQRALQRDIARNVRGPADVPGQARSAEDVALHYVADLARDRAVAGGGAGAAIRGNGTLNAIIGAQHFMNNGPLVAPP